MSSSPTPSDANVEGSGHAGGTPQAGRVSSRRAQTRRAATSDKTSENSRRFGRKRYLAGVGATGAWKHFERIGTGARCKAKCKHCGAVSAGDQLMRHIGACAHLPDEAREEIDQAAVRDAKNKVGRYGSNPVYREYEVVGLDRAKCKQCDQVMRGNSSDLGNHLLRCKGSSPSATNPAARESARSAAKRRAARPPAAAADASKRSVRRRKQLAREEVPIRGVPVRPPDTVDPGIGRVRFMAVGAPAPASPAAGSPAAYHVSRAAPAPYQRWYGGAGMRAANMGQHGYSAMAPAPYGSHASYGSHAPYRAHPQYGTRAPYGAHPPYGAHTPYGAHPPYGAHASHPYGYQYECPVASVIGVDPRLNRFPGADHGRVGPAFGEAAPAAMGGTWRPEAGAGVVPPHGMPWRGPPAWEGAPIDGRAHGGWGYPPAHGSGRPMSSGPVQTVKRQLPPAAAAAHEAMRDAASALVDLAPTPEVEVQAT